MKPRAYWLSPLIAFVGSLGRHSRKGRKFELTRRSLSCTKQGYIFRSVERQKWRASRHAVFAVAALSAIAAMLLTAGCATPHATLVFTAPSNVAADTPFTVTVTVLYAGKPDSVVNSPIRFSSSDPAAALPGNYYFTQSDAGSHTWTNGFTLKTAGTQTISGYLYFTGAQAKSGINGSATITVSH